MQDTAAKGASQDTDSKTCESAASGASAPRVVGLIADLLFGSQIKECALAAGASYVSVRTLSEIKGLIEDGVRSIWVINLMAQPSGGPSLVDEALMLLISRNAELLCYAPHVAEDRIAWATKAGAKSVVPRGAAVVALKRLIDQALS